MAEVSLKLSPFKRSGGDQSDFSILYNITDTDDIDEAYDALVATAEPRIGNLFPHHFGVSPTGATDLWDGEVTYQPGTPKKEATYSIEINTASVKFTQSLATIGRYGLPGVAIPNLAGAIGSSKDGVEGCDVNVPAITWNERHIIPNSRMGRAYVMQVYNLTARMNDADFRIFAAGEALFLGATLNQSAELDGWEGNFRWVGSPNAQNINVGGITVTEKLGHDYLWTRYNESKSNNVLVKIPYYVFVERVYQFGTMSALQLDDPL